LKATLPLRAAAAATAPAATTIGGDKAAAADQQQQQQESSSRPRTAAAATAQQQQQQQSQAFASHFAQPQVSTPAPLNPDLFSQQIMASMFANSLSNNTNAQPDQIELWRRAAIGSIPAMPMSRPSINPNPTSVHDLRVSEDLTAS